MKNQYFGDVHDLFKYDLVLEILSKTHLSKFTFIPMLTPNDNDHEGRRITYTKNRAGYHRFTLRTFLETRIKENRRNINELYHFFKGPEVIHSIGKRVALYIHCANENGYFTHEERKGYFESIPQHWLKDAIILVDPDIGIEVKSASRMNLHKYVTYSEIQLLFNKMNDQSVLIIFQYIPRVNRLQYYEKKRQELCQRMSSASIRLQYISDNQVVFFILTKKQDLHQITSHVLTSYASLYKLVHHNLGKC